MTILDALNSGAFSILLSIAVWNSIIFIISYLYSGRLCKAIPLPRSPLYEPSDASVVLAVVDPPKTFTETVIQWAQQEPLEIILVTTPKWKAKVDTHVQYAIQQLAVHPPIHVLVCKIESHREQQVMGYRAAQGRIILRSDDDIFWHHPQALSYLLAPFGSKTKPKVGARKDVRSKDSIGAVVGMQMPVVPGVSEPPVTPWQALSIKSIEDLVVTQKICYAADGGLICLIGRAVALRADLIQNEEFYKYFLNEPWIATSNVHSGDDTTITRWVQARSRTSYQSAPEAMITTLTKNTYQDWIGQCQRWLRIRYMHFIKMLWGPPRLWIRIARQPYTTFHLIHTLTSVPLGVLYFVSWLITVQNFLGLGLGHPHHEGKQNPHAGLLAGLFVVCQVLTHVVGVVIWTISLAQRFRLTWLDTMKIMSWRLVGSFLMGVWTWLTVWVDKWGGRTGGLDKIDVCGNREQPKALEYKNYKE
ncbi:putative N-acetylglucosaminyltransferase [Seiridium cardinale]